MRGSPGGSVFTRVLADAGFDIAHDFDLAVARDIGFPFPANDEPQRGVLIGNTRRLWPCFVKAMRDPDLAAMANPLEDYTELAIETACPNARLYYSHRRHKGAFLPFQRLAVAAGLGAMSDGGLVIHPVFGPWFALRAVAVVAGQPVAHPPIAKPCTCTERCGNALREAQAGDSWRAWLGVREACTLDHWRYSDEQIRYHYTKVWDPEWCGAAPIDDPDPATDE